MQDMVRRAEQDLAGDDGPEPSFLSLDGSIIGDEATNWTTREVGW